MVVELLIKKNIVNIIDYDCSKENLTILIGNMLTNST